MTGTYEAPDAASDYDLEAETLAGDIRDVLLTHVRAMEVGWRFLSEREQEDKIFAMQNAAGALVRQAVNLVTTYRHPHIHVALGAWKVDKEVEIKIGAAKTVTNIEALAEHGKGAAVLVLADPAAFNGQRAEARPDPDQPSMLGGDDAD